MQVVLDAYALLVYLQKEKGYEIVNDILIKALDGRKCLLSAINWGEIYYIIKRKYGQKQLRFCLGLIDTLPIDILSVDRKQIEQAAEFKSQYLLSYADCFAAALARLKNAQLVTGDKEFLSLQKEIEIIWI